MRQKIKGNFLSLVIFSLIELIVLCIGLFLTPEISIVAKIGVFLIPIIHFIILFFVERNEFEFKPLKPFVIFLSSIYVIEIALEYIIKPQTTKIFGIIEYILVFICVLVFAIINFIKKQSYKQAVKQTSKLYLYSIFAWNYANFLTLYIFWNTELQNDLLKTDGTLDDFLQNGKGTYETFIIEDYIGGAFFHTFLFLIFAILLVTIIYLISMLIRKMIKSKIILLFPSTNLM